MEKRKGNMATPGLLHDARPGGAISEVANVIAFGEPLKGERWHGNRQAARANAGCEHRPSRALVVAPRRVILVAWKYERRSTPDQRFDQHQFLIGVIDERRAANTVARLRAAQDIQRAVMVRRRDGFRAFAVID